MNRRILAVTAIVAVALMLAIGIALTKRSKRAAAWIPAAEGFLAVATPCCYRASLWSSLEIVAPDGQRARPASTAEAARWLDSWPYRSPEDRDSPPGPQLSIAAQSSEVRCSGPPTGDTIPKRGQDEETLDAIRLRHECVFAKWKVWSAETADRYPNERHVVWVDEDGFFHGRVDYWQRK